jgi:hypothetical protein
MSKPFRTERSIVPEAGIVQLQVSGTITFEEAPELRDAIFSALVEMIVVGEPIGFKPRSDRQTIRGFPEKYLG